jgi:hypothetical protein
MPCIQGVSVVMPCGRFIADENAAIWTGLARNLDAEGEAAIRNTSPFWKNHDQGAATVLVAGLDPALDGEFAYLDPGSGIC